MISRRSTYNLSHGARQGLCSNIQSQLWGGRKGGYCYQDQHLKTHPCILGWGRHECLVGSHLWHLHQLLLQWLRLSNPLLDLIQIPSWTKSSKSTVPCHAHCQLSRLWTMPIASPHQALGRTSNELLACIRHSSQSIFHRNQPLWGLPRDARDEFQIQNGDGISRRPSEIEKEIEKVWLCRLKEEDDNSPCIEVAFFSIVRLVLWARMGCCRIRKLSWFSSPLVSPTGDWFRSCFFSAAFLDF